MDRFKLLIVITLVSVFSGCAGTYKEPIAKPRMVSGKTTLSRDAVIKASKTVLLSEGYQISSYDDKTGFVSTAPHDMRLSPLQADCGKTMGLDYLKDIRTTTKVAYGVIYDEGLVTVKANIQGEYKPGSVVQDITLSCVSRGSLESDLLTKILSTAN